jgi:hypothetical protein
MSPLNLSFMKRMISSSEVPSSFLCSKVECAKPEVERKFESEILAKYVNLSFVNTFGPLLEGQNWKFEIALSFFFDRMGFRIVPSDLAPISHFRSTGQQLAILSFDGFWWCAGPRPKGKRNHAGTRVHSDNSRKFEYGVWVEGCQSLSATANPRGLATAVTGSRGTTRAVKTASDSW